MQISSTKHRDCFSVYMDKHKESFIVILMILFSLIGWLIKEPEHIRIFDGIFIGLLLIVTCSAIMLILLPKVSGWRRVEKNALIFISFFSILIHSMTWKHITPWMGTFLDFFYIMRLAPLFLAIYYLRKFINIKIFLLAPVFLFIYMGANIPFATNITEGVLGFFIIAGIYSAFYLLNGCKSSIKINAVLYVLMYFAMSSYMFFWLISDHHHTWNGIFTYFLVHMKSVGPVIIFLYILYEIFEYNGGSKRLFSN